MSTVTIDETKILEATASATGTEIADYFQAIRIKHLGYTHIRELNNTVIANTDLFADDIRPILPNSFLSVFISTSGHGGTSPDIRLIINKESTSVTIDALDSTALTTGVGVEFRIPASREEKYNIQLTQACTVDSIKVVEYHQAS